MAIKRFNPRTHEGCDTGAFSGELPCDVSIHAPMKGATHVWHCSLSRTRVSIHAPMKGATFKQTVQNRRNYVSIHAPMKGATADFDWMATNSDVSIHAPMKGATYKSFTLQ